MTPAKRKLFDAQIRAAMNDLVLDPRFGRFIDLLREQREVVIEDACAESTVASQRASMAAIGELRTYKNIIGAYEEAMASAEEERNRQSDAQNT